MNKYQNDVELFKSLCKMNKKQLQYFLYKTLKSYKYKKIKNESMYLIAEGNLPICLCAHMDTVFTYPPNEFFFDNEKTTLWSPTGMGADDRAGILIILKLIYMGYRPSVVFTDLEESGGKGAEKLVSDYGNCPFRNCKALIQLDRRGSDDAVYYSCANDKFEDLITSYGFVTEIGSFSDISVLAPIWEKVAVNLSVGYMYEHTRSEYLNFEQLNETFLKVRKMLDDCWNWKEYKYKELHLNSYYDMFDWTTSGKDYCICCGEELKKDYYSYNYENITYKMCPTCYAICFSPGEDELL